MAGQLNFGLMNAQKNNYWYRQGIIDRIHYLCSCSDNNMNKDTFSDEREVLEEPEVFEEISTIALPSIIFNGELELFSASIQLFGGWENAIARAGLEQEVYNKAIDYNNNFWTPENALQQIMILHHYGFDLSSNFIKHVYPALYNATEAKDAFKTWLDALSEAGVTNKYIRSNTNRFWSINRILRTIPDYDLAYGNIQPEMIMKLNPSLYSASHRYFKTWLDTVNATGIILEKNKIKVVIEPLRDYLLMECLKKVFDAYKFQYREIPVKHEFGIHKLLDIEISKIMELPSNILQLKKGKDEVIISASYRSWGLALEERLKELQSIYPRIEVYSSVGEPRRWPGGMVNFHNTIDLYNDLTKLGRDDLVAELGLMARGGIPKEHQQLYEAVMKEYKST
jgi:hypothetical protein